MREILAGLAILVSLIWNYFNWRRSSEAIRISRFERDVGTPLREVIERLEGVCDACRHLIKLNAPLAEKRAKAVDIFETASLAQEAFIRHLRRAVITKSSLQADWTEIVMGEIDRDAIDALAEAVEESITDTEQKFDNRLKIAADNLERVANSTRAKIESE